MSYVAKENDLKFGEDVKLLTVGDSSAFNNYLMGNLNKTEYGVVFCVDNMNFLNVSIPCKFDYINKTFNLYTILYNYTNAPNSFMTSPSVPLYEDAKLSKLKLDLDNAFMEFYHNKSANNATMASPKISLEMSSYPIVTNRMLEKADVIASSGAFYLFFPPMICFVVVLLEVIREKDLKLRKVFLLFTIRV